MAHAPSLIPATKPSTSLTDKALKLHREKLVKQSKRLVAQTFYGTMLKQMRNSPFKSKIFDGGRGGEAFSSMLDQHLADHMANAKSGGKLANLMADRLEAKYEANLPANMRSKPVSTLHKKTAAQVLMEQRLHDQAGQ